jgi:hypothetical protein
MGSATIIIKNDKIRRYYLSSWVFILFNISIQLYLTFTEKYKADRLLVIGLLLVIFILLFVTRGNKFNYTDKKRYAGTIFFLLAAVWIYWQIYWAAALIIFIDIFFIFSTRKFEIKFADEHIIYPSFPVKKILWNELSNVILKDGLLTIDFKNNKILQAETEGDDLIDEKEFNEFCKQHLSKG